MKVAFHPQALEDLHSAAAWHEERRTGLGLELTVAVEHAAEQVLEAPERWPRLPDEPRARRYVLRRFPFSVCYAILGDIVFVVALAHSGRDPDYWKRRLAHIKSP
ncbi:MAG: type II toxin-antitoxin system RelE/ParE family toxin [Myxococcales bacterium]|nr:type II toxin-antitoxin system RelE/ParE family toxin [Myxococcales bacterium]